MQKVIVVLFYFFVMSSIIFSQDSWNLLTTQEEATILDAITFKCIKFTDENNGWACGSKGMTNGAIFKTEDGGSTWSDVFLTGMFDQFNDLCFCDNNVIWAGGYKNSSGVCLFYKSDDGGTTWNPVTLPENLGVKKVYFADQNNGWVILRQSGSSRIYHTSDGGANWTVQMNGTTSDGWTIRELYCWHFFDANNAIAAGTYGYIIYTNDGGATWNYRDASVSTQLSGMHFVDDNNGWIVGGAGYILKTTDGGVTWSRTDLEITQSLWDVYFIDENTGWVVGGLSNVNQGIVYSTVDGGVTWTQETLPSNRDLNCIFFLDDNIGWIGGNYGTVYKYGSATDVEQESVVPTEFRLEQNYPNPFNPSTKIKYHIAQPGFVRLAVYDILGREIQTLVDEYKSAGNYEVIFAGEQYSSGIYFYSMKTNHFLKFRSMVLLR